MAGSAVKLLSNAFKKLQQEPVEGFCVELPDESNLFEWRIWLEGPKDTPYEGGIFQCVMKFPQDYPMSPPTLHFVSEFWHPNVYLDGKVCISILHPPGEDEMSGERPEERWLPTQTVATILLSVISMLNDPNFSSPANVDASVEWRRDHAAFVRRVKRLIEKANKQVPSHVKIPHPDTDPEERRRALAKMKEDAFDLYDDNDDDEGPEDDEEQEDDEDQDEDDEGEDETADSEDSSEKAKQAPKLASPKPANDGAAAEPASKPADPSVAATAPSVSASPKKRDSEAAMQSPPAAATDTAVFKEAKGKEKERETSEPTGHASERTPVAEVDGAGAAAGGKGKEKVRDREGEEGRSSGSASSSLGHPEEQPTTTKVVHTTAVEEEAETGSTKQRDEGTERAQTEQASAGTSQTTKEQKQSNCKCIMM